MPFTLKDTHETAGRKTTVGFPPFADYVAREDSPVVARLKAAGGVLMAKTNVATMLGDWQSNNPLFGRTSNPWDLPRTAGGSSGGAAAALCAGMTPFEIGTDMQDSIRLPAAFCGVYGFNGGPCSRGAGRHSLRTGQLRHIEVQIHPVDAFQLEDDIFMLEFRDVFWQSHGGVWWGICYPPSLENTSRFDGSIRHSSRDAAILLQPDTTLSKGPKQAHE